MKKIVTIVGTRPELIKLSRVISELDNQTNHILVHTGQNYDYELNEIFFSDLEIRKPDYFLNSPGNTPMETISNILVKTDELFDTVKPDAVLVYGDTNSCLAVISAKRKKIPVFHMEAGNRCFDQRVPEEINRKIVDHLSDINMTLTEHARRYLIMEGVNPETIIKTGSSMKEVLSHYKNKIEKSDVLNVLNLCKEKYFVVSIHREENVDSVENFDNLLMSLNLLVEKFNYDVIVSTHPRTKKKLETLKDFNFNNRVRFLKPLGFFDYISMQMNAYCTISDSGTITEEASLLKFPAITIRQAHERPEGMDEGSLLMSGLTGEEIYESVKVIRSQYENQFKPKTVIDYDVDYVSYKVVRIILSYIGYINRTVWKAY